MTMIRVRNVPEELHSQVKMRAAAEGVTLSELTLGELRRAVARPSLSELRDRFSSREGHEYNGETATESVRAEQDAR